MRYKVRKFNKLYHYLLMKWEQNMLYLFNLKSGCKVKIVKIDNLELGLNFAMKDVLRTGFSHCIQLDPFKLREEAYKVEELLYSTKEHKVILEMIHQHGFLFQVEYTKRKRKTSIDNFKYIVWSLRYLLCGASVLRWERKLTRNVCNAIILERKSIEKYGNICI